MECLYYTDGIISNRETLTKLCILFDKVRTFFLSPDYFLKPLEERWKTEKNIPFFSKSPSEKDLLSRIYVESYKRFIDGNDELINANILQPLFIKQNPPDWENFETNEKKLMKNGSGIAIGIWGQNVGIVPQEKIYIDSPWFSLYRWQSISGALHFAIQTGHIPISDNPKLSKLACDTVSRYSDLCYKPTPEEIASHIAFRSIALLIPNFPPLKSEEILNVREKLYNELQDFRNEMLQISKEVDEQLYTKIDSIVRDKVFPRLDDLKLKIKSSNDKLFCKIASYFFVGSGATALLTHFLSLPLPAKIISLASFAGKILLDIHKYKSEKYTIKNESINRGLVFLFDLEKKYG